MSPTESSSMAASARPVPPQRLAEASVWIARLHGDARGRAIEDGLRRWLQEDADNARAFELATEVWEESEQLRRVVPFRPLAHVEHRSRWRPVATAIACAMLLVIVGVVWFQYAGVIATGVGEQRQLALDDGTRVLLNTDTRIVVKYDRQTRRVELRQGEALFSVARQKDRSFVVVVGDRQVRALGTCFLVRKDSQRLAVTLVEGSALVAPLALSTSSSGASPMQGGSDEFALAAGQRLTFSGAEPARLDTPSMESALAWRRRQVILDDTPLSDAVAEMNRYNETRLVVRDPEAAALLINGLFQAGDSIHFANAVAQAYGLTVVARGDEIVLSGKPVH